MSIREIGKNMREIHKNLKFGKIQNIDLKANKVGKSESQSCDETSGSEETVVKDFSNPKAETFGRSQVSKSDNLESDIAFGIAHHQAITNADKFFDTAFKKLLDDGDPNAYGKASTMTDIFTRKEQLL